jgi:uncharacterized protein YndB with AHSA1/START domain
MNGTLHPVGDRWQLVFVRPLAHPAEAVWRAVTETQHLKAWFPQPVSGEFVAGGQLTFHSEYAEVGDFHGTVLAVDPPRLLEFTWGEDTLRIEIEPSDSGCTLTFRDTITELGKAARDAAGWHVCLDGLAADLGAGPAPAMPDSWQAIHPSYVSDFGPAAATIGPPQ